MTPPKLNFAFVCDDVRREDNGKMIYIGAYGRDVRVANFPATVILSLVLSFDAQEAGQWEIEIECQAENKTHTKASGDFIADQPGAVIFPIRGVLFSKISEPTELVFKWRLRGAPRYRTALRFPLSLRPSI